MRRFMALALTLAVGACSLLQPGARRYVVFFQEWSADLDNGGIETVMAAAKAADQLPGRPIIVSGYADPEGSPQANKDISRLRAQVVSDALVKHGVAASRLQRRAMGAVGFALDSQESRRVDIYVGAP
jgi:outer membrane protein OmpA-like peptidoglycan-associated protein